MVLNFLIDSEQKQKVIKVSSFFHLLPVLSWQVILELSIIKKSDKLPDRKRYIWDRWTGVEYAYRLENTNSDIIQVSESSSVFFFYHPQAMYKMTVCTLLEKVVTFII
jgi:hypothetical protein